MKTKGWGILLLVLMAALMYRVYHNSDFANLKCIISTVDGEKYCVRDRLELNKAADKLARTAQTLQQIVDTVHQKYPNRSNCKRLKKLFNPSAIQETLPTSELTAYSENKGEKIAFCLNASKTREKGLIDDNTLLFVAIHELAHIATLSVGHTEEFWDNFRFLLHHAESINVYTPIDYNRSPQKYCGMTITDNPYYS